MIIKLDIPIPIHLKFTSVKNQLYILNVQVEWSWLIPTLSYLRLAGPIGLKNVGRLNVQWGIKLDIPIPVHLKFTSVNNQLYILTV